MNIEQEKKYAYKIFILTIFLMVASAAGLIYAFYTFFNGEPINNNIFEMIFYVGHILILVFALYFANQGRNKGLYVIKKIMYQDEHGTPSIAARIIAWVLIGLSFIAFGYFGTALFVPALPRFKFPVLLVVILTVVPLTVWTMGLFFVFQPIINLKLLKQNNKS